MPEDSASAPEAAATLEKALATANDAAAAVKLGAAYNVRRPTVSDAVTLACRRGTVVADDAAHPPYKIKWEDTGDVTPIELFSRSGIIVRDDKDNTPYKVKWDDTGEVSDYITEDQLKLDRFKLRQLSAAIEAAAVAGVDTTAPKTRLAELQELERTGPLTLAVATADAVLACYNPQYKKSGSFVQRMLTPLLGDQASAGAVLAGPDTVGDHFLYFRAPKVGYDRTASVRQLIQAAISRGAPTYNRGDKRGCAELYLTTASDILADPARNDLQPAAVVRQELQEAVARAQTLLAEGAAQKDDEAAWLLRHAFDRLLDLPEGQLQPGDTHEGDSKMGWWITPEKVGCDRVRAHAPVDVDAPDLCHGHWNEPMVVTGAKDGGMLVAGPSAFADEDDVPPSRMQSVPAGNGRFAVDGTRCTKCSEDSAFEVGTRVTLTQDDSHLQRCFESVDYCYHSDMTSMAGREWEVLEATSSNGINIVGLPSPDGSQNGIWYFPVTALTQGWVAYFAGGKFKPGNRGALEGQGVTVVSETECRVPGWCGHGSTFRYQADADLWEEFDHSAERITCKWMRIEGPHHEIAFEGHYARVEHEHTHRGASGALRPVFKLDRPLGEGELTMVRSMAAAEKEMCAAGRGANETTPSVSFIDMWTKASLTELSAAIDKAKAVNVDTAAGEARLQMLCKVTLERALKASSAASVTADEQLARLSDEEISKLSAEPQVRVSGCGDEQFNGVYEPDGENNGVTQWRRRGGEQTLTPQRGTWYLAKDHCGSWWYKATSSNKLPPTSGWDLGGMGGPPAPNIVVMNRLPDYKISQLSAAIQEATDVGIDIVEAEARLHELKSLAAKASLEIAIRTAKRAQADASLVSSVAAAIEDAKAAGVDTTEAAAQLATFRTFAAVGPLTAALDAANAAHDAYQTERTLGVNWVNVGSELPSDGVELTCPQLAFALKRRAEFALEDLNVFEVPLGDLKESHYIRSGSAYFKPVVPDPTTALTARNSKRWMMMHPDYEDRMVVFKLDLGSFGLFGDQFQLEPTMPLSFKWRSRTKATLLSFDGRTATWKLVGDDTSETTSTETLVWKLPPSWIGGKIDFRLDELSDAIHTAKEAGLDVSAAEKRLAELRDDVVAPQLQAALATSRQLAQLYNSGQITGTGRPSVGDEVVLGDSKGKRVHGIIVADDKDGRPYKILLSEGADAGTQTGWTTRDAVEVVVEYKLKDLEESILAAKTAGIDVAEAEKAFSKLEASHAIAPLRAALAKSNSAVESGSVELHLEDLAATIGSTVNGFMQKLWQEAAVGTVSKQPWPNKLPLLVGPNIFETSDPVLGHGTHVWLTFMDGQTALVDKCASTVTVEFLDVLMQIPDDADERHRSAVGRSVRYKMSGTFDCESKSMLLKEDTCKVIGTHKLHGCWSSGDVQLGLALDNSMVQVPNTDWNDGYARQNNTGQAKGYLFAAPETDPSPEATDPSASSDDESRRHRICATVNKYFGMLGIDAVEAMPASERVKEYARMREEIKQLGVDLNSLKFCCESAWQQANGSKAKLQPSVVHIGGRRGWRVDRVELSLSDGTLRQYGGMGGNEIPRVMLNPRECIVAVKQAVRSEYLGDAFEFELNSGRRIVIAGEGAEWEETKKFEAPLGQQVVGLELNGPELVGIVTITQGHETRQIESLSFISAETFEGERIGFSFKPDGPNGSGYYLEDEMLAAKTGLVEKTASEAKERLAELKSLQPRLEAARDALMQSTTLDAIEMALNLAKECGYAGDAVSKAEVKAAELLGSDIVDAASMVDEEGMNAALALADKFASLATSDRAKSAFAKAMSRGRACMVELAQETLRQKEREDAGIPELEMPKEYLCPIMCTPMHDPVVAGDGFTYERSAIAKWLEEHSTSPLTNEKLQTDSLVPNKTLKIAIKDFPKRQHERLTNAVHAAREGGKTKAPAPSLATLAKVAKFAKRQSSKKLLDASQPPLTREKSSNGAALVTAAIFAGMDTDGDGVVTREELEAYLTKTGGRLQSH